MDEDEKFQRTVTGVIPATVPVFAIFSDKQKYPVICWEVLRVDARGDDGEIYNSWSEIVGMIFPEDGCSSLESIRHLGAFKRYVYK